MKFSFTATCPVRTVHGPKEFIEACSKADCAPTRRQFKKWQRKTGLAWTHRND